MFYEGDLQSGIALALQQSKAVLCFVHGNSEKSREWEDVLVDGPLHKAITSNAICLRMKVVSRETSFLGSFCPIKSTPAIVVIRNGTLQLNLQSSETTTDGLKDTLGAAFSSTSPLTQTASSSSTANSRPGQGPSAPASSNATTPVVSAPNSASRASHPSRPNVPPSSTPQQQVSRIAAPPAQPQSAVSGVLDHQQARQREDYVKMQKDREQKQLDERQRIKQQIKSDREERRRLEQVRKQSEASAVAEKEEASKPVKSSEIRVQVRMFDGTTQRHSFPQPATISNDVRPWIDSALEQTMPYTLKLILTPLPNRNIEPGEEEQSLIDLGIKGSCTFVMVPIKGYVDSYAGAAPGLVGSAVSGGYNLVAGTAGAVLGGVKSVLGFGRTAQGQPTLTEDNSSGPSVPKVRVRTLADQRAEEAKRDQQFYNGNQLNFQPRGDEDENSAKTE